MENKRILVIGGTGYIGKSLVKKLIGNGYNVALTFLPYFLLFILLTTDARFIIISKPLKFLSNDFLSSKSPIKYLQFKLLSGFFLSKRVTLYPFPISFFTN